MFVTASSLLLLLSIFLSWLAQKFSKCKYLHAFFFRKNSTRGQEEGRQLQRLLSIPKLCKKLCKRLCECFNNQDRTETKALGLVDQKGSVCMCCAPNKGPKVLIFKFHWGFLRSRSPESMLLGQEGLIFLSTLSSSSVLFSLPFLFTMLLPK